jgi:AcrR family transcriptional regulator
MTSNRIKEVALLHFAKNGYEGASLSAIAAEVGIKKQSIYTHFKGKDDLFLEVLRDVFGSELSFVTDYIGSRQNKSLDHLLHGFLEDYAERYAHNGNTKFWLRMSFFPPAHLYHQVMEYVYDTLDQMEAVFFTLMKKAKLEEQVNPEIEIECSTAAFMGVLDGVFVEMLYGGPERMKKRIDASWYLYWKGLSRK